LPETFALILNSTSYLPGHALVHNNGIHTDEDSATLYFWILIDGFMRQVNYHPETGWLGVRGFKDSRVQGVGKKSTMPLLESLTPVPLQAGLNPEMLHILKLKSSPKGEGFSPIPRVGQ
jgi:hypothetical protein